MVIVYTCWKSRIKQKKIARQTDDIPLSLIQIVHRKDMTKYLKMKKMRVLVLRMNYFLCRLYLPHFNWTGLSPNEQLKIPAS